MALQIQTSSTLTLKPYHHHRHPLFPAKSNLAIKSQKLSTETTEPTSDPTPPKKQTSPAQGFGSISSGKSSPSKSSEGVKKKQNGKRAVIRRSPLEKPAAFMNKEDEAKIEEMKKNESAFLLTWFCLGGLILVEGILLSASGFLPEEWDKFLVKYLYPVFTPTVFLFVAGTVVYGVSKYLQNEKLKE